MSDLPTSLSLSPTTKEFPLELIKLVVRLTNDASTLAAWCLVEKDLFKIAGPLLFEVVTLGTADHAKHFIFRYLKANSTRPRRPSSFVYSLPLSAYQWVNRINLNASLLNLIFLFSPWALSETSRTLELQIPRDGRRSRRRAGGKTSAPPPFSFSFDRGPSPRLERTPSSCPEPFWNSTFSPPTSSSPSTNKPRIYELSTIDAPRSRSGSWGSTGSSGPSRPRTGSTDPRPTSNSSTRRTRRRQLCSTGGLCWRDQSPRGYSHSMRWRYRWSNRRWTVVRSDDCTISSERRRTCCMVYSSLKRRLLLPPPLPSNLVERRKQELLPALLPSTSTLYKASSSSLSNLRILSPSFSRSPSQDNNTEGRLRGNLAPLRLVSEEGREGSREEEKQEVRRVGSR